MVDLKPMIEEHKKEISRRTLTVQELAESMGISVNKARQLTHAEGFPVIVIGHTRLTITSKLEEWIDNNIGLVIK